MTNNLSQVLDQLQTIRHDLLSLERLMRCVQIEVATDACREIERTAAIDARLSSIETSLRSSSDVG